MKILVADDEEVIRELVRVTLASDPAIELYIAGDGEEAVRLAYEHRPELIILDVRMPRKDGYQACREIRADARTKDVMMVMLTALGQDADKDRGIDVGANDYFVKPFSPAALLSKVYGLMDAAG